MGSSFMQQFLAGWQMGQDRIANQRQAQMMQMRQEQEAYQRQQDQINNRLRMEEATLRKKAAQFDHDKAKFDMMAQQAATMPRYEQTAPPETMNLGGATPDAPSAGMLNLGPTVADRQMTAQLPGTDQQVPLLMREDIQAMEDEKQRRMIEALLMKHQATQKSPEELYQEAFWRAKGQREGAPPVEPRGPSGSFVEAVGADGKPVLFNATTGEVKPFPAGVSPKEKPIKVTAGERQTLAFYERATSSADTAAKLEESIAKMGLGGQARMKFAPNFLQSDEGQAYNQAQKEFTEARLRKESGAAIPPSEFENDAKTYFIQPGDSPKLIKQKQAARQRVIDGLKNSAGGAYAEKYGGSPAEATGLDPAVEAALKELGY